MLLIRHGQYHLDTDEQGLTELGRLQSKKTGERLREWTEGVKEDKYGKTKVRPCQGPRLKLLRKFSNYIRAI